MWPYSLLFFYFVVVDVAVAGVGGIVAAVGVEVVGAVDVDDVYCF